MADDRYMINTEDFWQAGSTITLCVVPWSQTQDAIEWGYGDAGVQKRDAWFDSLTTKIVLTNNSYIHLDKPVPLEVPYDEAFNYNYLVVDNPSQPVKHYNSADTITRYCYFIKSHEMASPLNTIVTLELDVMTTYRPYFKITSMLCQQGQVQFANNAAQNITDGITASKVVVGDEGLDLGNTYLTYDTEWHSLSNENDVVAVITSLSLTANPGSETEPKINMDFSHSVGNVSVGCGLYLFPYYRGSSISTDHLSTVEYISSFGEFTECITHYSWVAQGIQAMYYIPGAIIDAYIASNGDDAISGTPLPFFKKGDGKQINALLIKQGMYSTASLFSISWKEKASVGIPDRYSNLPSLLCYPYTVFELANNQQTSVEIKPEELKDNNGVNFSLDYCCVYPNNVAIVYPDVSRSNSIVENHTTMYGVGANVTTMGKDTYFYNGSDIQNGIWFKNFPTFTIYNNNAQLTMANNAYNYQYSYDAADWAYTAATAQNNLAADITQSQIDLGKKQSERTARSAERLAKESKDTAYQVAGNNATSGIVGTGVSAIMGIGQIYKGDMVGGLSSIANAAQTGVQTAMDYNNAHLQADLQNNISVTNNSNNYLAALENAQLGTENNDKNRAMANTIAEGNKDLAWKQIATQKKNASLTPPSALGAVGGSAFYLATGRLGVKFSVLHPNPGAIARAGDYMLRFGCAVNKLINMPDSLLVCDKFTYWKGQNLTFATPLYMSETNRNVIRALFQQGCTFWNNPDDIENFGPDMLYSNTPHYDDYYEVQ